MTHIDARKLSPAAKEDLRRRVVAAVLDHGVPRAEAARIFGVSYQAVHGWVKKTRQQGRHALKARRQGRPPKSRLTGPQAATVVRVITTGCPDQVKLPFVLWTREAVQQLLCKRYDLRVSVWTVGRYLRRWGLTPQKPVRRAYEQNPEAVRRWLDEEYPAIRVQAKRERAEIHWGDEMGLRSDYQAGRSYGRKGQTPMVPGTGKRFRCNVLSTITNRGTLCFMVFRKRFTSPVFIAFLQRLLRHRKRKLFLILDSHPVHKAKKVQEWVQAHPQRLRLFYLPTYSPELNPDELLNHDVKTNAVGRRRPESLSDMEADVRGYLRSTQKYPAIVKNYFRGKHVAYAAH